MSTIVRTTDFLTGDFLIAQDRLTTALLETCIANREREYLIKLLGAELYALFLEDLTGEPPSSTSDRFTVIFEEGAWDFDDCGATISNGIKWMLQGVIYFHFVKDNNLYHTITGLVSVANENANSELGAKAQQHLTQKYALAIDTFTAIQGYINENSDDYPEYNGTPIRQSPFSW